MFRALINDAKSAAGSAVGKYVVRYLMRASVALPFVVAMGFVTAAITLMAVDRYGAIAACWMVGGGFALLGLLATLAVVLRERRLEIAERRAADSDVVRAAGALAAAQAPMMLLGALLSSSVGSGLAAGSVKALARNLPLVALVGMVTLLMKSTTTSAETDAVGASTTRKSNGAHPSPNDLRQEAA